PELGVVHAGVPRAIVAICARALAFRREDRFETAAAMGAALESQLASLDPQMTMRTLSQLIAERLAEHRRESTRRLQASVAVAQPGVVREQAPTITCSG